MPRPGAIPLPKRTLLWWGHHRRARMLLYALAILGAGIPSARTYRYWTAWPRTTLANPAPPSPGGTYIWFEPTPDALVPLDAPTPTAVGFDFTPSSARWQPIRGGVAFNVEQHSIADLKWADPARQPPPDPDELAPKLIAQMWWDDSIPCEVKKVAPGVYEARYINQPLVRTLALQYATKAAPLPLVILLASILLAQALAWAGRRAAPGPHECKHCGYPVGDLPEAICPECGTPAPALPDNTP